ncbi:hypothetical protein Fleli_1518 [Bernardetia litoralis DSM 6794]|uniref:Uncharacterized protein n=1 Tax=Bernardetia litoralis (strain ATCC 23117 / DSM 6794 / NBRC 15988 / NCIMB 1366 / Fx l1 / Sio-4) TaxID=880071 RepID=I4AJ05_BERLS|nr:hypothetical protein [Bernardetia litoralis]AFM03940.1 hypothetical protein Fleli_1518 [Bernardetia litoralis DSM 6794]
MKHQSMTLNIRHDLPNDIWENMIPKVYKEMEGWLGFSQNEGIPYWFNFEEAQKHVWASVEPSGLVFEGLMKDKEWEQWKIEIKKVATQKLGFKVGEIELGEVE